MSSLQAADREAAAVAKAPRVALADIEAAIGGRFEMIAGEAMRRTGFEGVEWTLLNHTEGPDATRPLDRLSICILVMKNGFTIIGKSAPASPENFNRELGKKLAYEDAVRQLWPLMGFALRDRLASRPA